MSLTEKEARQVRNILEENVDLEDVITKEPEEAVESVKNELNKYNLNKSQMDKTENVVKAFAMTPPEELRKLYNIEGTTPEQREVIKATVRILIIISPDKVKDIRQILKIIRKNHQEFRQAYRDGEQQLKQVIDDKL